MEKDLKKESVIKATDTEPEAPKRETEAEMRARIEAEVRAEYEAKARAEAEARVKAEMEANAARASSADVQMFKRPVVEDKKLAASLDRAFDRLELYYPEGKVFAFDSIDSGLRERMSGLYKEAGYSTLDEMLGAYGFEIIAGSAVRDIRNFVRYSPGKEPGFIKGKVDNVLTLLAEYYPDHLIPRAIQNDHKSLAGKVSGLYQWLGYEDQKAFLSAYGYEYNRGEGGRPAQDYQAIIDALVEKYKDGNKPKSMGQLLFDNPDLKGTIKSLQNKSNEMFGMSLKKYFEEIGIFEVKGTGSKRVSSSAPSGASDAVLETLTNLYSNLDASIYGTVDEAMNCLKGMTVKRNKAGQVYIFRAASCAGTVTIPHGIDFISPGAFSGQANLEEIIFLANLTEIPSEAFSNCPALTSVHIPETVVSVGEKAFANCRSLKSVSLPESVQKIAIKGFAGCSSLAEVEIANPRIMVSEDAFDDCPFEYVPAPEAEATDAALFDYTIDRKGNATITGFKGGLEEIIIPGMIDGHPVTTIGKDAFQGNKQLVDVSMSDYIETMQGGAFRDCISLRRIHLSNGISKVITTSFNGCIGLEEVNIPDEVTVIKKSTFKDSPLTSIHIGKSLMSIDSKMFNNCEYDSFAGRPKATRAINKITVDPANRFLKASGAAVMSANGKTFMAFLGNAKKCEIPEGVERIAASAFEGLMFLSDINIPDSVIEIGERAFAYTSLRSVTFGQNVRKVKDAAFSDCHELTAVVFNDGIEEIGDSAFAGCPIFSVWLPASLKVLGKSSFSLLSGVYYYDTQLQKFEIDAANPYLKADGNALYSIAAEGKTLQTLYGAQFHDYIYDNKIEYEVEAGTVHIAPSAFGRCKSLGKVTLPDGLLTIGNNAFEYCQGLTDINLPDSLERIGNNAFKWSNLKKFKLGASVSQIGEDAFITGDEWPVKRTKLRSIEVDKANATYYVDQKTLFKHKADGTSAAVVYFGGGGFVALPDGVSEICKGAFKRSIMKEIQIPSSVTAIGEHAFEGCRKLVRLRIGFAEAENSVDYAVIYIPEVTGRQDYTGDSIHDQYMDCIRIDENGNVFDFVKYDSLFETIRDVKDKILVATDRLKSGIQLVPLYRDKYLTYLRKHAQKAVEIVVEFDDLSGLNTLAELDVFTGKNIDEVIELANKAKKPEILSYLMNYKNSKIGITGEDYDL